MYKHQLSPQKGGIFFIGEAPSDEDYAKGYPLVDSQGFLLSRALRAANMVEPSVADIPSDFEATLRGETRRLLWERRRHSFATVFNHPLGRDDWKAATGKNPPTLETLTTELQQTQPHLIVALGDCALCSITGESSIESFRGATGLATQLGTGIKYIATYSPHHVNQRFKFLTVMIGDLVKASHEARFPELRPQNIELWLEPTLADLAAFERKHIASSDLLTIDIETGGHQISCVGIGTSGTTGLVLPFVDYQQADRSYWRTASEEQAAWKWLAGVLDSPTPKLMQNGGAFDVFWFLDKVGISVRNYRHDLRLAHHVLFPELPKSLAFMGATYTNLPSWKAGVHHDDSKRDA